jgi:excisionase family DNA binding protein
MRAECYSATEAARALRVSIPTLKEMCASGRLAHFLTPGGHLRIPAEALEGISEKNHAAMGADIPPSPALESRTENLNREKQGRGAKKGNKMRRLKQIGDARCPGAEASGPESENKGRWRESSMESEPEELGVAWNFQRQETPSGLQQERNGEEVQIRLGEFRRRWRSSATDLLPFWLSFEQHEEALDSLYRVIARYSENDEGRMQWILRDAITRLLAPWEKERQVLTRREQLLQRALWSLSGSATAQEKAQAASAIRRAIADLPFTVLDHEERSAAEEAVRRVNEQIQSRLVAEEKKRVAKEAEERKGRDEQLRALVEQQRKLRRGRLIQLGGDRVWWCLLTLKNDDRISEEDYDDIDQASLRRAVDRILRSDLTGDETNQELEKLVHEIVVAELEIE